MAIAGLLLVIASDAWVATSWRSFGEVLGPLLQRGSLIPVVFTAIMLGGAFEFLRLMRAAGLRPHGIWAMLMIAALMLTPWVYAAWIPTGNLVGAEGLGLQMGWLALTVFGAALLQLWRRVTEGAIHDVAATLLMTVYCGFLPSFLILIRCDTFPPAPQGAWLVLLLLAITKASDIGAYFAGSAIGRHKLIPAISPGKSIEGVVGGLAASVGATLLLWYLN
ncbi:MAG: phosphatidate cytidylyltransferase, partial [Phycisphaerales bacterium]